MAHPRDGERWTLFDEIPRDEWSRLSGSTPLPLTANEVETLRGLGDRIDLDEVDAVYRPISNLLNTYVQAAQSLRAAQQDFLETRRIRTPYVIGVAGSVAVGKSTTARLLAELLRRWPNTPRVQLVTTDGFLYPNAILEHEGILDRKGFPESYDRRALLRFMSDVKSGKDRVTAPVYSHLTYDIVPGEEVVVSKPEVLIVEGLNVLQPANPGSHGGWVSVSDFFDFSVYVDARTRHIREWYIQRFLDLRRTAFSDPDSYFRRYASLSDEEAVQTATEVWDAVNGPNLLENVKPTRGRASLILRKEEDHSVSSVLLRRI